MLHHIKSCDKILIDTTQIENDTWAAWYYFLVKYDAKFPDYESYADFMLEVGNNHKAGMTIPHFVLLLETYSRNLLYGKLIEKGLMTEEYTDDGTPYFRLHLNV